MSDIAMLLRHYSDPCILRAAGEIGRLRAELAAKDARIAELGDRCKQQGVMISALQSELFGARNDNEALRKELDKAKAEIDKMEWDLIARDKATADMLESRNAALETANARIEELEAWKAHHDEVWKESIGTLIEWQDKAARAERAEAELLEAKEQAHYTNGVADLAMKHRNIAEAERDALREVLEQLESILVRGDKSVSYMLMKVRAALDPGA